MPELTLRDYLSLLGLALVIIAGVRWITLIRRRRQQKVITLELTETDKEFSDYLLGRLMSSRLIDGLPSFQSKHEALKHVLSVANTVKYDYATRKGFFATDRMSDICEHIVVELCSIEVIPYSEYSTWR